jgi:hypothetical protein
VAALGARLVRAGGRAVGAAIAVIALGVGASHAVEPPKPVKDVGPERLEILRGSERGQMPLYASKPWGAVDPAVTRAVIIVHGLARNAGDYFRYAMDALGRSGAADAASLVLAPQFLADDDIAARALPASMLRWHWDEWSGGGVAHGPIPLSSYAAVDALLAGLADRTRLPKLQTVVLAGYSAGGQVVQRYAAVGEGEGPLAAAGVHVRYVVGSPSTYVYFSPERPRADGSLGAFAGAAACPRFDRWKYGLAGGLPDYVRLAPAALERRYAGRDVVYLLGTADTDPHHPALDVSCAAEAQGPSRYQRGLAYVAVMRERNPDGFAQRQWSIPGVAHDGRAVLNSACGLAALFDTPGCGG